MATSGIHTDNTMLDLTLLKSFVAVVDCASFTRAAERLHLTQSTVSQQIRRLEEAVGRPLLERGPRYVRPTEDGERLLSYARRLVSLADEAADLFGDAPHDEVLRLGLPEDFAAGRLTPLLARFGRDHPGLRLEVTSGLSGELQRLYDAGELDLILVKQLTGQRASVAAWPEPLVWIDSLAHPAFGIEPLPLAVFPPGGLYRNEMIHALEVLGRHWRISYCSTSLTSLCAAVGDGLGVSLIPRRALLASHRVLEPDNGLPVIEVMELSLQHRPGLSPLGQALAARLAAACPTMMTEPLEPVHDPMKGS
ncbi:LysR family transcriptional regulator [Crenobacter sp. SG2305]|uniref:LysR family transcriptional regulator n=1 Tax=Crenobacter oryzisoli TaxID=3056844 RepID=UPI0025AB17D6|nr:LysR family transcriptional regulator [Crenobacter sp. SG2305]MDN0083652.1 LysR family transcriptional regulator [Crenobacter sp. SG2305]